jgi:hypothetical protein
MMNTFGIMTSQSLHSILMSRRSTVWMTSLWSAGEDIIDAMLESSGRRVVNRMLRVMDG